MNLFESLLVGHLIGDYILQTRWMAQYKEKKVEALLVHSAVYAICVFIFAWPVQRMPAAAVLLVFLSHVLIDQRLLVRWWMKHVSGCQEYQPEAPYLRVVIDQGFHIMVLALVAYASLFHMIK